MERMELFLLLQFLLLMIKEKNMFFRCLLILFLVVPNIFADDKLRIGVLYEKIFSSKKEAQVGVKLWIEQSHIKAYAKDMEVIYYKNDKKLLEDYIKSKIEVVIVNPSYYFKKKESFEKFTLSKWLMSRTKDKFEQFYLITNSDTENRFYEENIKEIYYKLDLAKVWLYSLSSKDGFLKESFEKKLKEVKRPKKLILNQFFKKNNYSVVSKDLYESMVSLNPQIKSKIKIVAKSKALFFRLIGLTRKGLEPKFNETVINTIHKINITETNFERTSFFKVQTVYILEDSDLEELGKMHENF